MAHTDEELVDAYRGGEAKALEELIRRYMRPIFHFVMYLVRNEGDAEDIAQEVFVNMWKHLETFDRTKKFKTWIFAIAKNASYNWIKKKKPLLFSDIRTAEEETEAIGLIESIPDETPRLETLFEKADLARTIDKALRVLNPIYSSLLVLHYREELTLQEIAESQQESLNTVKSRHRRALMQLKTLLRGGDAPELPDSL